MKKIFWPVLSLLMLAALQLNAQNALQNAEEDGYYATFRVQVAAAAKPLNKNHRLFTDFKEVEGVPFDDGYTRYLVGKFETFHEADTFRKDSVVNRGYKQAYIIALHKGKRYTVDEAIELIYAD